MISTKLASSSILFALCVIVPSLVAADNPNCNLRTSDGPTPSFVQSTSALLAHPRCSCTPSKYTFTFALSLTCFDNYQAGITMNPGIEDAMCGIYKHFSSDTTDFVPVKVRKVSIYEAGPTWRNGSSQPLTIFGPFEDGEIGRAHV